MSTDIHAALHRIAARDGGVVTRDAACRAGLQPADLAGVVGRRNWPRAHRGVYLPRHRVRTAAVVARAAVAALDPQPATVSHHTAARLHGIPLTRRAGVDHVTVPRSARRPHRPRLQIHAHDLAPDDVTTVAGLAVTSPVRTLVDLLLDADHLTAVWACEFAVRGGLVTADQVRRRLGQARRVPGIVQARERFDLVDDGGGSMLETAFRLSLHDARPSDVDCRVAA
jgi:hypothetical protein